MIKKDEKQVKTSTVIIAGTILGVIIGSVISVFIYRAFMNFAYYDVEDGFADIVKSRYDVAKLDIEDDMIVTLDDLKQSGSLEGLGAGTDSCDGYVRIYKDNGVYKFKPFITCDKYTTVDYDKYK